MSNIFDPFGAEPNEMPRHRARGDARANGTQPSDGTQPAAGVLPTDGTPAIDAAADGLLDGSGTGPLHELLMAARGPGSTRELAGEDAAVAAFRAAGLARPLPTPSRSRRLLLRRLLAVKVGAAAAAVALGGVAVAASTGVLPLPLGPADESPGMTAPPMPSSTGSASSPIAPSAGTATSTAATPPSASASSPPGGGPSAAAALTGLCRAYLAHVAAKPDKPWDGAGFTALSAAAGGDDKVLSFCTELISAAEQAPRKDQPTAGGAATPNPATLSPAPPASAALDPGAGHMRIPR